METYLLIAVCAVFTVGVTGFMISRERELGRDKRLRMVAIALFLLSAAVTLWVSYAAVFPPAPLAEGDLQKGDGDLTLLVPSGRLEILVHGEMAEAKSQNGQGRYTVEAREGSTLVESFDGTLDHHVETRRAMKKLPTNVEISHLEGRHDLPSSLAGRTISFAITRQEGNLKGTMHVTIVPASPPDLGVLIAGIVFGIVGGALDRRTKLGAKSYVSVGVGFYFGFSLLVLQSSHPLAVTHVLAVIPMGLLLGAAGGGVCRLIAHPFVKPLPGPPLPAKR